MKTKRSMVKIKKVGFSALAFMVMCFVPGVASAQSGSFINKFFSSLQSSIDPVKDNKVTIMAVVGVIGMILAIVAWGSNSNSNDPKLTNVVKGAFLIVCVLEAFMAFL